jgi:hypothetical protein
VEGYLPVLGLVRLRFPAQPTLDHLDAACPPARRVMLAQSDVTMSREFAELTRRRSGTDIRLSTKVGSIRGNLGLNAYQPPPNIF